MKSFKFVLYFVTKKEVPLPFVITVYRSKRIFILLLLLFLLSNRESMARMLLVGAVFALE